MSDDRLLQMSLHSYLGRPQLLDRVWSMQTTIYKCVILWEFTFIALTWENAQMCRERFYYSQPIPQFDQHSPNHYEFLMSCAALRYLISMWDYCFRRLRTLRTLRTLPCFPFQHYFLSWNHSIPPYFIWYYIYTDIRLALWRMKGAVE